MNIPHKLFFHLDSISNQNGKQKLKNSYLGIRNLESAGF
jgi:hypothetical protein